MTRAFPFDQYQQAFEFIEDQGDRSMKVMIDM